MTTPYPPIPPPPYPPQPPARPRPPRLLLVLVIILIALLLYRLGSEYWSRPALEPRAITPRGDLAGDEKTNIDLFKEASPSVVFITTLRQQRDFWTRNVTEVPQGTGSGFVWDDGGHIVTNFHVIGRGSSARVTLSDQSTYTADLVGAAPAYDLALLRITAPKSKLRPIPLGTSNDLLVGQKVFAIGNPFGLDHTLTTGIVSALGRSIPSPAGRPIEDVIQTDASINPGNSGGPLLDSAGRLIGVNAAILSPSGTSAGVGFAIPVDTVNRIIPELLAHGQITRPQLGVRISDPISQRVTRQLGVPGVLIMGIEPDSPAAAAGLRPTQQAEDGSIIPGDIIEKIDGQAIRTADQLFAILEKHKPGDTLKLTIYRDGEHRDVDVKLAPPKE